MRPTTTSTIMSRLYLHCETADRHHKHVACYGKWVKQLRRDGRKFKREVK